MFLFYFLDQEKKINLANLLTDVKAEDYLLCYKIIQNHSQ